MRKLRGYIGQTVVSAIGLVLVIIVGLDAMSAVIDESTDISETYTFTQVAFYVALSLPARIYEFLPFAALIGCLIGLGSLATTSELVVMRSAGVSTGRLVWTVMQYVLLLAVLGVLLGEYVVPATEQMAQSQRAVAQSGDGSFTGKRGLWNREGNTYVHFNAVERGGVAHGLTLLQFDNRQRLQAVVQARQAIYQRDHWVMEDVTQTEITSWQTSLQNFHSLRWDTGITPELLSVAVVAPQHLSIRRLYQYSRYLEAQGLDADDYRLALWGKLLQPLGVASLVLVAISFIFGPLRDGTMGFRIVAGVVVGIAFRTSQDLLGPASLVFGFAPIYAVLTPIALCAGAGLLLLRRAR